MTNRTDRAKNAGEIHFLTSVIQAQKVAGFYGEAGIIIRQSTLILIGGGWAGLVWCLHLHFVASGGSFEMEHTPKHLVVHGPYQFTRNPMYLCSMVIFYGSVAVLVGFVVVWGNVALLVVPWEERKLETRFGEAYLQYKNSVPWWLGKRSR